MSTPDEALRLAVAAFVPPDLLQPLGEAGAIRSCSVQADALRLEIDVGFPLGGYETRFTDALRQHLAASGYGGKRLDLTLRPVIVAHSVQRGLTPLQGVRNVIAVASGKGGVGKSTVAVNLALAWRAAGARVGLLDADIYGPSLPLMLGLVGQHPSSPDGKRIRPLQAHGISAMSVGFLVDPGEAVV